MGMHRTADPAALIEESRAHIARIHRRIEETRDQVALGRELMAESQRYFELIEEIQADQINRAKRTLY